MLLEGKRSKYIFFPFLAINKRPRSDFSRSTRTPRSREGCTSSAPSFARKMLSMAWHHWGILIGQSLSRTSSYKYVIRWLCLWSTGLHTRGFSFDRPLALRARVLSKLATRVQPVDHAPPSYNIYKDEDQDDDSTHTKV